MNCGFWMSTMALWALLFIMALLAKAAGHVDFANVVFAVSIFLAGAAFGWSRGNR